MNTIKELIREIHRRSLWQVLGIFLAASWGVLQVVQAVTDSIGLPDWTPGMAFVLLLIGLPVVLATAFVQEGMPGGSERAFGTNGDPPSPDAPSEDVRVVDDAESVTLAAGVGYLDRPSSDPRASRRLFTWRNAVIGGVGAFALLGFSLVAYFVMWTTGMGPVGNLTAQGVFEDGETVVLADFENRSADDGLGAVVTEALRVDLGSSQVITLAGPLRIDETLALMQRTRADGLSAEVAREVAVRRGIKAVVDGEVGAAGTGYILTANIRAAETGLPLATFRRTADGPESVIDAIDGLSQDIRERAGESLRDIKSEGGLEEVTTSSLEALRLYSQAEELMERGQAIRSIEILEQALELDAEFAMAWRKLSVAARSGSQDPELESYAATRAYELRHRLTEEERLLATAYYNDIVEGDVNATIRAYEAMLDLDPENETALNNIALSLAERAQWEQAIEYLVMADAVVPMATARVNLAIYYSAIGRVAEASEARDRLLELRGTSGVFDNLVSSLVGVIGPDPNAPIEPARAMQLDTESPIRFRHAGLLFQTAVRILDGDWEGAMSTYAEEVEALVEVQPALAVNAGAAKDLFHTYVLREVGERARAAHAAWADGGFGDLPVGGRDYVGVTRAASILGDAELARDVLEEWQNTEGAIAPARASEYAIIVDALGGSPEDRLRSIDTYREQTGCTRCYSWEYAELLETMDRLPEAADEFGKAMSAMWYPPSGHFFALWRVFGHERLGELHEEMGDPAQAVVHYQAFVDRLPDARPPLRARVDRARARIEALKR
mgnify:FL=1